jgi:hypothetical protein
VLDGRPTPEAEKSGLTELELRKPPVLSLPMTGEGRVLHVGEKRLVRFQMDRVTNRQLKEHGLPFTVRKLRTNADHEEKKLVDEFLQKRAAEQTKGDATSHTDLG